MAINDDSTSLSQDYILMNDIDVAENILFTPIGTETFPFTGTFDGRNFTISNITFSDATMDCVGFFGYTEDASISNLVLKNVSFEGYDFVGGLIGLAGNTSISNSSVINTNSHQISGNDFVGGFVGAMLDSDISNSYATGNVEGIDSVGGLVGSMTSSSIHGSYATGNVEGDDVVGGFVGNMDDSLIFDCYATGDADGGNEVGGFVGTMRSSSSISWSYAMGDAEGTDPTNVGGFVGLLLSPATVVDSFYVGTPGSTTDGSFVDSSELMQIDTFKAINGYVSMDWDISDFLDSTATWYINEGQDYPKFYWQILSTTYTITFDSDSGTGISSQMINGGDLVTQPSDPVKSGYAFVEWQLDGVEYDFSEPVISDLTLTAIYIATHTVTFNSDGGTVISSQTINDGDLVTQPADPVKSNYAFVEWQSNGVEYDFSEPVTSDLTLTAIYIATHTVTFNSDGGTVISSQTINDGDLVTQPADPVKSNYAFVKWQSNGVEYDFSEPVTSDLTLVAIYTSARSNGGGSGSGSAKIVDNASQNNELQNNTPQNNTPQNNTPQNNTPQNNELQNNTPQNNNSTEQENPNSLIWWGLGAVLLIAIICGIVYVFYFKKK